LCDDDLIMVRWKLPRLARLAQLTGAPFHILLPTPPKLTRWLA